MANLGAVLARNTNASANLSFVLCEMGVMPPLAASQNLKASESVKGCYRELQRGGGGKRVGALEA